MFYTYWWIISRINTTFKFYYAIIFKF
jgi:hypothetical protein